MQRIKEYSWGYLYEHTFNDVIKHSISLYMLELMYKTLKQPEKMPTYSISAKTASCSSIRQGQP